MSAADEHVRADPGVPFGGHAEGEQAAGQEGEAEALAEGLVLALLPARSAVGHRLHIRGRFKRVRLRVHHSELLPGECSHCSWNGSTSRRQKFNFPMFWRP